MNTFADFKAMIPAVLGIVALLSGMVGLIARLYHKGALEKKDVELKNKDAELARAIAACAKADERANNAGNDVARNDLAVLQRQLQALVEGLAISVKAQAASLYIPVLSELTKQSNTPRSFAFVAVHNADPRAAAAIRKMGVVEIWTIVGECWQKNAAVANSQLQADTRHLKSYDAESGFVPINTLVLPIRWQDKPIGVLQLFNRQCGPNLGDIDAAGFSPQDKKFLSEALKDLGPAGIASKTNQFQGSPAVSIIWACRENQSWKMPSSCTSISPVHRRSFPRPRCRTRRKCCVSFPSTSITKWCHTLAWSSVSSATAR